MPKGAHPTLYLFARPVRRRFHLVAQNLHRTLCGRDGHCRRYAAGAPRFYTDMEYGGKYWTFISQERRPLPVPSSRYPTREDNFVAGLSMGGYGAFKLALRCPEAFAATASLSGALDMAGHIRRNEALFEHQLVYGDRDITGTDNDLLWSLQEVERSEGPKPRYINAVEPKTSSMKTIKHSARPAKKPPSISPIRKAQAIMNGVIGIPTFRTC